MVNDAGQIELWDTATLQLISRLDALGTNNVCLALLPGAERLLLAAGAKGGWVKIWDVTDWAEPRPVTSFQAHANTVAVLKFDPRGQVLLSSAFPPQAWAASNPENFKGWDASSWRERPEFRVGSQQAAYLPEANVMAVRRGPLGVFFSVRDVGTARERMVLTGHKHATSVLAFSPDGRWLASGCWDGTVKLWEVGPWRCAASLSGGSWVRDIAFSPDSQRLVVASNPVILWDLAICHELATLPLDATPGDGTVAAFSPDGDTLAVRDSSGVMHFWRAPPLAEIKRTVQLSGKAGRSSSLRARQ
jgi:WD40 repeat protein